LPAKDYFLTMGLSENDEGNLLFPELFPVIFDLRDGSLPYIRAILANLEDGSVVINGGVKVGATISVSSIDLTDLQISADKTLEALKPEKDYSVAIFHSCAARYFIAFGYDVDLEIRAINKHFSAENTVPYIFSYSGGEICPVIHADKTITNRVHTFNFTVCIF
jgi:hypothetical protein